MVLILNFFFEAEDDEETEDPGDGQKAGCGGGSPPFRRPRWLGAPPRRRHPGPPSFLEANGRGARVEAMPQCGPMISQST